MTRPIFIAGVSRSLGFYTLWGLWVFNFQFLSYLLFFLRSTLLEGVAVFKSMGRRLPRGISLNSSRAEAG
ncbi:MAG: hypothetical protein ACOC44_02610 [Promethearchaeia archaeon]